MLRPHVSVDGAPCNRVLASVSVAERARLAPFLDDCTLQSGRVLFAANAKIDHVWFPHDAVTSAVVTTPSGDSVEAGLIGVEGMTGLGLLLGESASSVTVIVPISGSAARMQADYFVREIVRRDGETRRLLLRFANAFLAVVSQIAACNAGHTVQQRIARWLAMAHERAGRDHLALTHEMMAMLIGVRRASVTAVAGALRDAGAIEYSKGHVHVIDRRALESRACDCYDITCDRIEAVFS